MKITLTYEGRHHDLVINQDHIIRRLGYPKGYEMSEEVEESIDEAHKWYVTNGNPSIHLYDVAVSTKDGMLYLDGQKTESPKIYNRFVKYDVANAILLLATAGDHLDKEAKRLWKADYPDKSFFLDTLGSCITETIVSFSVEQIKSWANTKGQGTLSRYSPGYPGWKLEEQFRLMEIMQRKSTEQLPVSISESALLSPIKSQISLVGITPIENNIKTVDIECMQCSFASCSCRNKNYSI